jgi:hypothetical protein
MKLVFRHYLASLRERDELDILLPDLLSELGFNVLSRPTRGVRQHGVDVMAVGMHKGEQKVFLFSIKQGNLTRSDWNTGDQALRPSLDSILDGYVQSRIPEQYKQHKIVICLCFGGEIVESIREEVIGYTKRHTTERISYEEWNGDLLAGHLSEGVLKQQIVSEDLRNSFNKSIAMLNEPEVAFRYFSHLLTGLLAGSNASPDERVATMRRIYICLSVLFVWGREEGNLEAPYRASELAVLRAWHLVRADIGDRPGAHMKVRMLFAELVDLHFQVWQGLYGKKILPHVSTQHGVSAAVSTNTSVDVNLKLFETLGRISQRGLWMLWEEGCGGTLPKVYAASSRARRLGAQVCHLINNNPCLLSPMADEQSIDIGIALVFLSMMSETQPYSQDYATEILQRIRFSFETHSRYPTIQRDYRDLIHHPRESTEEYRKKQTRGSTLIPLVMLWASSRGATEATQMFADFVGAMLKHCNQQLWIAGEDTEEKLYQGEPGHGWSLSGIPITSDGIAAMELLIRECEGGHAFGALSAISLDHWPILVMACRHYRLPLPPNLWLPLLSQVRGEQFVAADQVVVEQDSRVAKG